MQATFNLQKILHGDTVQLEQLFQVAAAPAPAAALRKNTAEKMCMFLLKTDQFDSALAQPLNELQKTLAQHIAQDDGFYCNPEHPVRKAINVVLERGRTWYARDSKSSQQFLEKLTALIQAIVKDNSAQLVTVYDETQQWLTSEDKRAAMLESRLCETEINHFKTLSTEACVLDLINTALANKPFPHDLISGVTSTLKSELLHAYFISGSNSPFWKTWQRLLPTLGGVFSTIASEARNEDDEQTLYRTIPALLNELERSLSINTSNPDLYHQWIDNLNEQLMLAIKKQKIDCEIFSALNYPDGHNNRSTRVTADLLQQTNSLATGDWILFSGENGQTIRCKLALKNTDADQLLFVDNAGRKVMNKSMNDFAVCLSTGIAKKMQPIQTEEVIIKMVQALIDLQQQKKNHAQAQTEANNAKALAAAEAEQKAEALRKQAQEAEEKKRIVQELSVRRAAAQKALAEAAVIAEQRAQHAAELKLAQERERMQLEAEQAAESLQRLQMANINISALNLGARVELVHNNQTVSCKLAVIIAATGKYIFVDNLGRKVAELQREQLVQALLDNQLTLLNKGNSFDDQLVKVIRGLRKDIS
jgi:chemotaxis protein histidine kinase CheA